MSVMPDIFAYFAEYLTGFMTIELDNRLNRQLDIVSRDVLHSIFSTRFRNGTSTKFNNSIRINLDYKTKSADIIFPLYYTKWVNDGRGEVTPKRANYLRFVIDGKVIYTKRSRATKGLFFIEEGVKVAKSHGANSFRFQSETWFMSEGF